MEEGLYAIKWPAAETTFQLLFSPVRGLLLMVKLPQAQAEKLCQEAERLRISPNELARAAVADLLTVPDESFQAAADRILSKNEDLYRRLA